MTDIEITALQRELAETKDTLAKALADHDRLQQENYALQRELDGLRDRNNHRPMTSGGGCAGDSLDRY